MYKMETVVPVENLWESTLSLLGELVFQSVLGRGACISGLESPYKMGSTLKNKNFLLCKFPLKMTPFTLISHKMSTHYNQRSRKK